MGGHIKIDRKILEWEWYSDINTCRLFIHLLLKANWKDGRFQGTEVPRGSLVTSYNSLSKQTGLSVQNVRTAIKHLILTGEITSKQQAKFTVITVKNYDKYQLDNRVTNNLLTENQQASNKLLTRIEEGKKVRREESNNNTMSGEPSTSRGQPYAEIIDYLNLKAGTRYKHSSEDTRKHIRARIAEGYTIDDFKVVIDKKVDEWKGTPQEKYLRPATLFGTKMESYVNQKITKESRAKQTGFSNFQQRDYDFDALEQQLLRSQKGD